MDGEFFKNHPIFSVHNDALQLFGYPMMTLKQPIPQAQKQRYIRQIYNINLILQMQYHNYSMQQCCANSGFSAPALAALQLKYPAPASLVHNFIGPTGYYSAQLCPQGLFLGKAAKLSSDSSKRNATTIAMPGTMKTLQNRIKLHYYK